MAEENKQAESSMEESLASIRRVLSEDEEAEAEAEAEAPAEPEPEEEMDMAAAMEEMEPEPIPEPAPAPAPVATPSPAPEPEPTLNENILELTQQMIAQAPPDIGAGESILSTAPSQDSTDALQELAKALLSKRDIAIGNRDMTLEGLIREIFRPLLREWLDQNLPYLIERLVKKEIDHMVNRAERLDL